MRHASRSQRLFVNRRGHQGAGPAGQRSLSTITNAIGSRPPGGRADAPQRHRLRQIACLHHGHATRWHLAKVRHIGKLRQHQTTRNRSRIGLYQMSGATERRNVSRHHHPPQQLRALVKGPDDDFRTDARGISHGQDHR
ncbi:hypothetical protein FQZ97_1045570 [compost metagenome]